MAKQEPVKPEVPVLTISAEQMAELLKVSNGKFQDFEIEMIADSNRACYYPDFRRFIYRSAKLELDPLANEIHLEYRVGREGKPQAQLFVHIDGYRRKAAESGERGGFAQALGDDAHGKFVETTLWRKDTAQPFVSRVYFTEFLTPGQMLHNKMQYHMCAKCGESNAYRMAFPFGGGDIHSVEEGQLWQARDEETSAAAVKEPTGGEYVVTEKEPALTVAADPAPAAEVKAAESKPEPTPTATAEPTPEPAKEAAQPPAEKGLDVLWKESRDRLKAIGLPVKTAKEFCVVWLTSKDIFKPTPQDQLDAMLRAEAIIAESGLQSFLQRLEAALILDTVTEQADPTPAKASSGELKLIREHFPKMPVPVQEVAADWCYEQLKTPQQLEAFLISQGADKFNPEELEIFLGITRHLAVSQAPVLTRYCNDKKISYGVFADQLSAAVWPDPAKTHVCGAPLGLPANLVSDVFLAMVNS
tara:strand:+ start:2118 stop:3536 length:1419 start_codon:yes stop_codon:yes gene_type:complete